MEPVGRYIDVNVKVNARLAPPPPANRPLVKGRRLLRHPGEESREAGMSAERLDRGVVPRQFDFGQRGVDFIVAYLMDKDRRAAPAALQLWDQVMPRLFRL